MQNQRKNYYGLDIAKFVAAIMIISAHFVSERGKFAVPIDTVFSLYIFSVPFFFTCSAFLFFVKLNKMTDKGDKKEYFIKYEKRIWIMYIVWSAIYWGFRIADYIIHGTSINVVVGDIHTSLLFTTYSTIWFLPALGVAIAIVYMLQNIKKRNLIFMGVILYLIGCLGYSYRGILESIPFLCSFYDLYEKLFISIRNGVFNGVPFVIVGFFIAKKHCNINMVSNAILSVIFSLLAVVEAFICKRYFIGSGPGVDTLIMLVPAEYFIARFLIQVDIKKRSIYIYMRKLSLLMFTSQRLFLSAIPIVWPGFMTPFLINTYVGLIMMIGLIIAFDLLIIELSKKSNILKYLL